MEVWRTGFRGISARLLAIPDRLRSRLPHLTNHDTHEIDAEIRVVLKEIKDLHDPERGFRPSRRTKPMPSVLKPPVEITGSTLAELDAAFAAALADLDETQLTAASMRLIALYSALPKLAGSVDADQIRQMIDVVFHTMRLASTRPPG